MGHPRRADSAGVRQGTASGPNAFVIYMNDLHTRANSRDTWMTVLFEISDILWYLGYSSTVSFRSDWSVQNDIKHQHQEHRVQSKFEILSKIPILKT